MWIINYWIPGFWVAGFWIGDEGTPPIEADLAVRYIRSTRRGRSF